MNRIVRVSILSFIQLLWLFFLGGQKSKFVLSILRRSIPEKYNIDVEIPPTKKKCYIELLDGSSQI
jgi:hypothetical protein